jgi:multidrug transporter EmrE-like cation transporter
LRGKQKAESDISRPDPDFPAHALRKEIIEMELGYIWLIIAVVFNVGANVLLKYSSVNTSGSGFFDQLQSMVFYAAIILAAVSFFMCGKALKTISLAISYPIYTAGSIIFIVIVSMLILNEKISAVNLLGIVVATLGIFLITK